ncbi:MAG TPA: hypothetical protein VMZ29_02010 [Candidatus Bathyarchaeia archaeon]|nr:hypothetical protein [Candidatus Bathyarchaeia archaeon]
MIEEQRRTPVECIEKIFALIKKESPVTIGKICEEIGLVWRQADAYINLIKYIQAQPLLEDQKLGPRTRIISLQKDD